MGPSSAIPLLLLRSTARKRAGSMQVDGIDPAISEIDREVDANVNPAKK
jgi:hypothetical protein